MKTTRELEKEIKDYKMLIRRNRKIIKERGKRNGLLRIQTKGEVN